MIPYYIVAGIVGYLVGIIINTLADTMPLYRRPRLPIYPDGTRRPISAWSGIMAFVTGQRAGKASTETLGDDDDKTEVTNRLRWRHVVVEIFTPLLFMFTVATWGGEKPALRFAIWFVYLFILILITVIDLEWYLILFPIAIPSMVVTALLSSVFPPDGHGWQEFLIGGPVGFAIFFVFFAGGILFNMITGNTTVAFGFGDVMLATIAGFIVGYKEMLDVTIYTIFLAGGGALVYILSGLITRNLSLFKAIPYGPYIAAATALIMFTL